jgi:SET domain-containing protein
MMVPPLVIDHGPRGRGVFAGTACPKGAILEICPTIEVPSTDVGRSLQDYVFASQREGYVLIICGYGMLYNHSFDANVAYRVFGESQIAFVTTRDVAAGKEFTIDYGHNWWNSRSRIPLDGV